MVSAQSLFLRSPSPVPVNTSVDITWSGPGGIRLEGLCQQLGVQAPDGSYTCQFRILSVASREGREALEWYLRTELDLAVTQAPVTRGAFWEVTLAPTERSEASHSAKSPRGPAVRIAGLRADSPVADPFDTGYGATTTDDIQRVLEANHSKVGVYLNVPCAYIVAGASYWGRALRINDRWLQINTNAVVPGLGVRMRADLTLELDGVKRAACIHGVMSRKKDLPSGGAYKATIALMIRKIDEGDSAGLLRYWLERHVEERSRSTESKRSSE